MELLNSPERAKRSSREFSLLSLRIKAADKPQSFSIRESDIRKANLRRFLVTFCSAALAAKSEFSSSAITIPFGILIGTSGGRDEILNLSKQS